MTGVERIIKVLKVTPRLDDDELSEATGTPHRETGDSTAATGTLTFRDNTARLYMTLRC